MTNFIQASIFLLKAQCLIDIFEYKFQVVRATWVFSNPATYMQYKTLVRDKFGKTIHIKNWLVIFWQMSKLPKPPIIIIYHHQPVNWNHQVLP